MATLLVVDDDPLVLQVFRRILHASEIDVITAGSANEGLALVERNKPDVAILDLVLPDISGLRLFEQIHSLDPRLPVIFVTAGGASDTAIEAMKLGAFDYLLKPLDFPRVRELIAKALEIRRFMNVPVTLAQLTEPHANGDSLVGACPAMQEVYKAIGRVASQNVTVLIHGESGTGKELIARAIYQHSPRSGGRFLAVNCAAIPETLLESELFGHEKGSFTGADCKRIGKFEQCSGGTLFLDEVGDMSPLVQSKVLRVLQEQQFERVGGNETIETDVRIIAATNRNIEAMVNDGSFRPDLYYRLNGFSIRLPPLRARGNDIIELLEHFLGHFSQDLGRDVRDVSPEALEMLMGYNWPGNVREFQSVLKQALLQAIGPVLLPDFLPGQLRTAATPRAADDGAAQVNQPQALDRFIEERIRAHSSDLHAEVLMYVERIMITRVLRQTGANQSTAAKILGITRGSLRNKIRSLGIRIDQVVNVGEESAVPSPRRLQPAG
jgi:two-component system nitrogen regulation response regulator GlnG